MAQGCPQTPDGLAEQEHIRRFAAHHLGTATAALSATLAALCTLGVVKSAATESNAVGTTGGRLSGRCARFYALVDDLS